MGDGEGGRGGAGGDAELGEDVVEVAGHGVVADREIAGDLAVGPARGNEAQHLDLAIRETPLGRVGPVARSAVARRASGSAPSRRKAARAASISSRAPSPSPAAARQAAAISIRTSARW